MLDQKTVHELFAYDQHTGHLMKKARLSQTPIKAPQVVIDGKYYRTSTIVWLYVTGEYHDYIKRLNGNNHDNRWINFRLPRTKTKHYQAYTPSTPTPLDNLLTSILWHKAVNENKS